jgi:hypothetical protein
MSTTYNGLGGYGDTPTDVFFNQTPSCMIGITNVLMADGTSKMIKDIKPNDEIMEDIATNKTNTVRRIYKIIPRKQLKMIKIKKGLMGNSDDIICTDHPIWINDDENRIFPSNVPGAEIFKKISVLYDLQYETEGAFYANDIKVDSLPPNAVNFKLPYEMYKDKDNYNNTKIYDEDDEWRNKPKMINVYSQEETLTVVNEQNLS